MKEFSFQQEAHGSVQLLRLHGALEKHSLPRVETQVNTLFSQGQYCIILECRDVDYIGSTSLGTVARLAQKARGQKGDVKLINVPKRIYNIIDSLGFTRVLRVYTSEDNAMKSFA